MGTEGCLARMAFDTSIAESSCGPPMTVTPTAATEPSLTWRTAVETKSRSTLPSMIVDVYLPSSAADKLRIARGKRAWRCEVIVGLMSRTRCETVIIPSEPGQPGVSAAFHRLEPRSRISPRVRRCEPEDRQPFVDEPALGQHRNLETLLAKF